ncbi:MAG TPA: hypothetical protein VIV40_03450 [Kofleriaceae bacterium]
MGLFDKLLGKTPPQPKIVVEARPWVMVYDMPADWHVEDLERGEAGWWLQELKCTRTDGSDQLVLLAKDYAGPEVTTTHDSLAAKDWSAYYAEVFGQPATVQRRDVEQTLMERVVPAIELVAEAAGQRIHERYTSLPGHELIITAAGPVRLFERWPRDVDRWFSSLAFRPAR